MKTLRKILTASLILIFVYPTIAQTPETEPNNNCTQAGVITISNFGEYVGEVSSGIGGDNIDTWKLDPFTSGEILISDVAGDVTVYVYSWETECVGLSTEVGVAFTGFDFQFNADVNLFYEILVHIGLGVQPYSFTVSSAGGVLPVELVNFSATGFNAEIKLEWETVTETNNLGFDIERTRQHPLEIGFLKASWERIGFVQGNGTTSSLSSYSFIDYSEKRNGNYFYRLKQLDIDGSYAYSKIIDVNLQNILEEYSLDQNFPNPFNPSTKIKFKLAEQGLVKLKIYNSMGQELEALVNKQLTSGSYEYEFNAGNLPSGIYLYKISVGNKFTSLKKMLLLK